VDALKMTPLPACSRVVQRRLVVDVMAGKYWILFAGDVLRSSIVYTAQYVVHVVVWSDVFCRGRSAQGGNSEGAVKDVRLLRSFMVWHGIGPLVAYHARSHMAQRTVMVLGKTAVRSRLDSWRL
jgi:hypothetical protein